MRISFSLRTSLLAVERLGVLLVLVVLLVITPLVFAGSLSPGGNTTVVDPSGEGSVSVLENAHQPESPNIRLIVPTLQNTGGTAPSSIRIISVTGGTMQAGDGSSITLGASGSILNLSSARLDLRFTPSANWNTNGSFSYVVVDPDDTSHNSSASTATILVTPVNVAPVLKTASGSTGTGLAGTYYISSWDLTGPTVTRLDPTVNFNSGEGGLTTVWGIDNVSADNFSVRWTGQIKAPVDGDFTISTTSDDGVRVWIDGAEVIDNWTTHGPADDYSPPLDWTAGSTHDIEMTYYERGGGEEAVLDWSYPGQDREVIPQASLFPAIIRPTMNYVNGSSAVLVDDNVSISDVDSTTLTGATVSISNNYQSSEDSLQFTNQNGITGSYSSGTLTLSGTASLAAYQAALRSVKYFDSNLSPNAATRTIQFNVNDGTDDSNATYRNIAFSGVNSPPVISEGASTSVTMDEDSSPTPFSLMLDANDPDYQSISWSISSQAAHGTASAGDPGDSISISYLPDANYNGTDSFAVQASDGAGGTDVIAVHVTISSQNDPPYTAIAPSLSTPRYAGTEITLNRGTWSDDHDLVPGSLSYIYQWQIADDANGTNVADLSNTNGTSYTPNSDQIGKYIRAKVSVTDNGTGTPSAQTAAAYTPYAVITEKPIIAPPVAASSNTATKKSGVQAPASEPASAGSLVQVGITQVDNQDYDPSVQTITTTNHRPPITGTAPPGATVTILIHSKPITGTTVADGNGYWSWTPPVDVPTGKHSAFVTITDTAGATQQATFSLIVKQAPVAVVAKPLVKKNKSGWLIWIVILIVGLLFFWWFIAARRRKNKKQQANQ